MREQPKSSGRSKRGTNTFPRCSWTPDEDAVLTELVGSYGQKNWALISEHMPGRIGKQCRERWRNHLDPNIRKDEFTPAEDKVILRLVDTWGTRWARIASQMEGRTENAIKNRYYCFLKKELERENIKRISSSDTEDAEGGSWTDLINETKTEVAKVASSSSSSTSSSSRTTPRSAGTSSTSRKQRQPTSAASSIPSAKERSRRASRSKIVNAILNSAIGGASEDGLDTFCSVPDSAPSSPHTTMSEDDLVMCAAETLCHMRDCC